MGARQDLAAAFAALAVHALFAGVDRVLPEVAAPVAAVEAPTEIEIVAFEPEELAPAAAPPEPEVAKPAPPPPPRWLPAPRPVPVAPVPEPPKEEPPPEPEKPEDEEKLEDEEDLRDEEEPDEEEKEPEPEEEPPPQPAEPAPLVAAVPEIPVVPALPELPEPVAPELPVEPAAVEPLPAVPVAPAPEPAAPEPVAPAPSPAPLAPGPDPAPPAGPTAGPTPEGPLPAPGSPGEYDGPTGDPTPPGLPLLPGTPGAPVWTLPGVVTTPRSGAAPTQAPAAPFDPRAATKALGGTLQTRDKEKGINVPAAGEVASAVATAVRGTPAPHNGRATFEIRLGPKGEILGASVVKSSAGDPAQWQAALDRAKAQLAAQGLAMTGGAKNGAVVRVSITTKHLYPTGTGKKMEMRPQCANALVNEVALAAKKKADLAVTDPNALPPDVTGANPFVDENGMPCIPVGMSGGMDLSNIGAHRQLMVQTQFDVQLPDAVSLPSDIHEVNTDVPWVDVGKAGPRPTMPYAVRKRIEKRKKKK